MESDPIKDICVARSVNENFEKLLTPEALAFLTSLHLRFNERRLFLLEQREKRQKALNSGAFPDFLPETEQIRTHDSWSVAETPADLKKRWVEITGPTDRKMIINALNSGADVFMADFEDANSPTWENLIAGQLNLIDAVNESIELTSPEGKTYRLNDKHAVLFVRPRGWHLNEKHLVVHNEQMSASLFDFGLYLFHNAAELIKKGSGPYFYLPKLESHLEARLWNDVFIYAQKKLGIPQGTIRCTVLIETILAAFEMDEILYELKEHSAGLNAGRWDYIFSIIKKFHRRTDFCLPDRDLITMTVPFMRAYTNLLVKTCHRRGAHAIGGMAAFIPNRRDPAVTEKAIKKVIEDKVAELKAGFDGTWVAHPDLVPIVHAEFKNYLQERDHQKEVARDDLHVGAKALLDFTIEGGSITEAGIRHNIDVSLQYLAAWLQGTGAASIYNLMEDAATAEISRAQLWQWLYQQAETKEGKKVAKEWLKQLIDEELIKIANLYGKQFSSSHFTSAKAILEKMIFTPHFLEFLTLEAYGELIG